MRSLWNVRMARKQVRAFADLPVHPAIIPFTDVGTAAGKHYLVWPLVEGETLDKVVEKYGAIPSPEAARWRRTPAALGWGPAFSTCRITTRSCSPAA